MESLFEISILALGAIIGLIATLSLVFLSWHRSHKDKKCFRGNKRDKHNGRLR